MNRRTVLFVDDQKEILSALQRVFKEEEYEKIYVTSTQEAFEFMKTGTVDVLVSDMMMPDMNGLEFLRLVKEQYPETVRIILSGISEVVTIIQAINEGDIYKYITKPWRVNGEAKQIIRDALEYREFLLTKNCRKHCLVNNDKNIETIVKKVLEVKEQAFVVVNKHGDRIFVNGQKGVEDKIHTRTEALVAGYKLIVASEG